MTERTQSKSLGVRIVRLQSGEEIICQHSIEDGVHTLEKPAVIIPTSKGTIGLMPWLPYADMGANQRLTINDRWIVFVTEPHVELLNEYNSAFGSGLYVAKGTEPILPPVGSDAKSDPQMNGLLSGKNPALKLSD